MEQTNQKPQADSEVLSAEFNACRNRIIEIQSTLESKKAELRLLRGTTMKLRIKRGYLNTAIWLRKLIANSIVWRPGGVLIGAGIVAGVDLVISGWWSVGVPGFLFGATAFGALLYFPQDAELHAAVSKLQDDCGETSAKISATESSVAEMSGDLKRSQQLLVELNLQLKQQRAAAEECVRAAENAREHRLQILVQSNWKSLRSEEFEQFLKTVFTELGYAVELTKTTGDQGVDLILSFRGKRIAVQVKGYFNSVANSAVQEAHAGRSFYECDACAVITNSRFTPSCRELADKIGCVLIDEDALPNVVLGKIDLWGLCFEGNGCQANS